MAYDSSNNEDSTEIQEPKKDNSVGRRTFLKALGGIGVAAGGIAAARTQLDNPNSPRPDPPGPNPNVPSNTTETAEPTETQQSTATPEPNYPIRLNVKPLDRSFQENMRKEDVVKPSVLTEDLYEEAKNNALNADTFKDEINQVIITAASGNGVDFDNPYYGFKRSNQLANTALHRFLQEEYNETAKINAETIAHRTERPNGLAQFTVNGKTHNMLYGTEGSNTNPAMIDHDWVQTDYVKDGLMTNGVKFMQNFTEEEEEEFRGLNGYVDMNRANNDQIIGYNFNITNVVQTPALALANNETKLKDTEQYMDDSNQFTNEYNGDFEPADSSETLPSNHKEEGYLARDLVDGEIVWAAINRQTFNDLVNWNQMHVPGL